MTMTMKKDGLQHLTRQPSEKAQKAVQKVLANPEFQNAVQQFRIKWGIERGNTKREQNLKKLAVHDFMYVDDHDKPSDSDFQIVHQNNKEYYKDLATILKKFKLDVFYWMPFVWRYAKYENTEPLGFFAENVPFVRFGKSDDGSGMPRIVIELGASSTIRDVKAVWHYVEELRAMLGLKRPKFKDWKNFERDFRIYQLYEQRNTIAEIHPIIQTEYGIDLDYGNIKKIITTYRKRIGLKRDTGKKLLTTRQRRQLL